MAHAKQLARSSSQRHKAYVALIINAIIWGAAFPIIKPALDIISPTVYLYFRFLIAGIISLPIFLYYYYKVHPKISYILKVLLIELIGLPIPLLILYEGLARTSALDASLIGATGPIFVILGGILFLHERETKREWQGLALALLGSLMIVAEPLFLGSRADTESSTIGNLLILGYNLVWTIYALIAKKAYKKSPPLALGALTYLATAAIFGLVLNFRHELPSFTTLWLYDYKVLIPVLYMAIPGGILAFALYLYGQSKIEVSEANLFTYLYGPVAIPVSFLLLGEKPSLLTLFAILLITIGVIRGETKTKTSRG